MGTRHMNEGDRRRIREQAAAKRKAKENKQFWILMGVTLVVALVIFLIPVIKRGLAYPDRLRSLDDIEASWVVRDLNPRTNLNKNTSNVDNAPNVTEPRYYHLASMATPEGYTQEANFTYSSNRDDRDLHFIANEPGGTLESVFVVGIPNKDARKHATDATQVLSVNGMPSAIVEANIAGRDLLYSLSVYPQSESTAFTCLNIYLDTPHDASILVMLKGYDLPTDQQPPLAAFLTEAEALLPLLEIAE